MDVNSKIIKYEKFANEQLKRDLGILMEKREKIFEEISNYLQLTSVIEKLIIETKVDEPLKTQVDLGCHCYVNAVVPDYSKIMVSVGFNFFLEFSHEEALDFIQKRTELLKARTDALSESINYVKAQIRMVVQALGELQGLT